MKRCTFIGIILMILCICTTALGYYASFRDTTMEYEGSLYLLVVEDFSFGDAKDCKVVISEADGRPLYTETDGVLEPIFQLEMVNGSLKRTPIRAICTKKNVTYIFATSDGPTALYLSVPGDAASRTRSQIMSEEYFDLDNFDADVARDRDDYRRGYEMVPVIEGELGKPITVINRDNEYQVRVADYRFVKGSNAYIKFAIDSEADFFVQVPNGQVITRITAKIESGGERYAPSYIEATDEGLIFYYNTQKLPEKILLKAASGDASSEISIPFPSDAPDVAVRQARELKKNDPLAAQAEPVPVATAAKLEATPTTAAATATPAPVATPVPTAAPVSMEADMSKAPSVDAIEEALQAVVTAQGKKIASLSEDKEDAAFAEVRELLRAYLKTVSENAQENGWDTVPAACYDAEKGFANPKVETTPTWFRKLVYAFGHCGDNTAEIAKAPPATTTWKGLARILLPLTSDETLGSYGQTVAGELYADCCLAMQANDPKPGKDVSGFYKSMIADSADPLKQLILDRLVSYEFGSTGSFLSPAWRWYELVHPPKPGQDNAYYDVDLTAYENQYLPELILLYLKEGKADYISAKNVQAFVEFDSPVDVCQALIDTGLPSDMWLGLLKRVGEAYSEAFAEFGADFANFCRAWPNPQGLTVEAMRGQDYAYGATWYDLALAIQMPQEITDWLYSLAKEEPSSDRKNSKALWSWEALNGLSGQEAFRPAHPERGTFIMISGPGNAYNLVEQRMMDDEALLEQMTQMHRYINSIGTMTTDPDKAAFAVEFTCTYPSAGTFTTEDRKKLKGYGCIVDIKVLDFTTGKVIAAITLEDIPDKTLNLSKYKTDDTSLWPPCPPMKGKRADIFLQKLEMYLK